MEIHIAAATALLCVGCASTIDSGAMRRQLGQLGFTDATLAEVEALQPQLEAPFKLAVSPPINGLPWSPDEIEVMNAWADDLRAGGAVSELIVLPQLTFDMDVTEGSSWLDGVRPTAARHHADALLIVNVVQEQSQWVNPLAMLDLTIVGMFVVPGHHAESLAVTEGLLIDNRNEYVYGAATTEGSAEWGGPFAYHDGRGLDRQARLEALKRLGGLLERATAAAAAP